MTRYGISSEGALALKKLAKDMRGLNDDIEENGQTLLSTISGIGEGLGIYEEKIIDLVSSVNATQDKGRESVEQLSTRIEKLASNVEALVSSGL